MLHFWTSKSTSSTAVNFRASLALSWIVLHEPIPDLIRCTLSASMRLVCRYRSLWRVRCWAVLWWLSFYFWVIGKIVRVNVCIFWQGVTSWVGVKIRQRKLIILGFGRLLVIDYYKALWGHCSMGSSVLISNLINYSIITLNIWNHAWSNSFFLKKGSPFSSFLSSSIIPMSSIMGISRPKLSSSTSFTVSFVISPVWGSPKI